MINLFDVFLLMLFTTGCAWLWHSHGIRERALAQVKQHCSKLELDLLDDNVALKRVGFIRDAQGHKRLGRVYGFEFTVTGEQRHEGTITLFGPHVGRIELAPYPIMQPLESVSTVMSATPKHSGQVIELAQWRREHKSADDSPTLH